MSFEKNFNDAIDGVATDRTLAPIKKTQVKQDKPLLYTQRRALWQELKGAGLKNTNKVIEREE